MGLDMYIVGKRFLWSTSEEPIKAKIAEAVECFGYEPRQVEIEVMYWRKANAIHKWFVDNIQNGTDDCGEYDVSPEALKKLLGVCKTVLADRSKARELLPTNSGFFFGPTDYDRYYFEDLEKTAEGIEKILGNEEFLKAFDLYYHSSW